MLLFCHLERSNNTTAKLLHLDDALLSSGKRVVALKGVVSFSLDSLLSYFRKGENREDMK